MKKLLLCALISIMALTVYGQNGKVAELTAAMYKTSVMKDGKFVGKRPVVIDFYAVWCGPCKRLSPIMDNLAKKYAGKIDFYKVDVDKEKQLAGEYGISSIPYVLFISSDGTKHDTMGLQPEEAMDKLIQEYLIK